MNASGLSRWAEPVADDVGADATGGSATEVSSPAQADRSDPLRAPTRMAGNKRRTPIEAVPPETAVDCGETVLTSAPWRHPPTTVLWITQAVPAARLCTRLPRSGEDPSARTGAR